MGKGGRSGWGRALDEQSEAWRTSVNCTALESLEQEECDKKTLPLQRIEVGLHLSVQMFNTVLQSHRNLANANAKQGRFIRAEECLRELKTLRLSPNIIVLNSVINACSQAGELKKAEEWLESAWLGYKTDMDLRPDLMSFNGDPETCSGLRAATGFDPQSP
ncbi:unnamed protein product [Symbiodinium necroappetens]|uniref:Pentatricopeptide repeat-containing protein n=1 Tax=Symbiodinium necroappetens TaxID=1628268 RepID=A0A813A9L5_9DINO|nr:unnamed protein product [Symbiodinium necroappetens]